MGTVTVRVVPRAGRGEVVAAGGAITVRVAAPPSEGRATEEARRALAGALGVPPSRVSLRTGARSRTKVFEVRGLSGEEALRRLGAAGPPA
ncbi:MAG: DUF167 domain-containing protein [Actinobacteria bacterium]|nr:DUF167 domain-containing protein [Actinomycetota bacterium]